MFLLKTSNKKNTLNKINKTHFSWFLNCWCFSTGDAKLKFEDIPEHPPPPQGTPNGRAYCSPDTIAWTHLTFMWTSSSTWSMCKLDTHRLAASASSSSTSTLSSLRIFTVVTFPYRQNRLNTRSQLTGTRSSPCTRSTLLGSGTDGRDSAGAGSESPLAPTLRECPRLFAVSTRLGPPVFLYYVEWKHTPEGWLLFDLYLRLNVPNAERANGWSFTMDKILTTNIT